MTHVLRRLAVTIASLATLLLGGRAVASEVCAPEASCEPTTSSAPSPAPSPDDAQPSPLMCDGSLLIEGDIVPMSLAAGASAMAPRTLHAVDDAELHAATDRCADPSEVLAASYERHDDRTPPEPDRDVEGDVSGLDGPVPTPRPRLLSARRETIAPPRGVRWGIDRPPRS